MDQRGAVDLQHHGGPEHHPVKLFNYVQYTIDPTIAAVSGATIAAAVIAIVILDLTVGLDMLSERGQ